MVSVRRATAEDLLNMQNTNISCLPENYQMRYYFYHLMSWPQVSFVAENAKGRVVGYVLGKMEEDAEVPHGHITSISVLRSYRKQGVATRLLTQAHRCMMESFGARYVSLHVREGNRPARSLYQDTMGYRVHEVEERYYADGENAMALRDDLRPEDLPFELSPEELALFKVEIDPRKKKEEELAIKAAQAEKEAHERRLKALKSHRH